MTDHKKMLTTEEPLMDGMGRGRERMIAELANGLRRGP